MKLVVQRVRHASCTIDGEIYSKIGNGYMVLVGLGEQDDEKIVSKMAAKLIKLRVFEDENGKMNKSLLNIKGEMLVVSQFTLCGDCKKGTRPSFDKSETPELANKLYEEFVKFVKTFEIQTQTGKFAAHMDIELINDGPVTFMLEK